MFEVERPYRVPKWCDGVLPPPPHGRMRLGLFPTPVHRWHLPRLPQANDLQVFIKRDDLSGMQLSGNKVRKLEFLLAEAKANGHDCVITIGGVQSNHCRATAVASRYAGLDCHLILRNSRAAVDADPGLTGNLLVERLVGATVRQVSKEEYTRVGSVELCKQLSQDLSEREGLKPYVIPVGGYVTPPHVTSPLPLLIPLLIPLLRPMAAPLLTPSSVPSFALSDRMRWAAGAI